MLVVAVILPLISQTVATTAFAEPEPESPSGIVMLENFETNGLNKVRLEKKRVFDGNLSLETNPKYVRSGLYSARMDYDMIGILDNPSQISIGAAGTTMPIPGYPKKIGMWVYGNNDGHLLTTKFRDGKGSSFTMDLTDDTLGVNWSGWRYLEVELDQGKPEPIVLELFLQMKQSDLSKKNKGSIWVDDIRLIYDPVDEDMTVPVLMPESPAPNESLNSPLSEIVLSATDAESGINPDTALITVNGKPVKPVTYENEKLTFRPVTPLGGGYHEVYAEIRDKAGNPATSDYSFTIEHGARLIIDAPSEAVSNELYRLQLSAKDLSNEERIHAKLKFDPATLQVQNIEGRPGLVDVQTEIDNVGGYVEFQASGLNGDSQAPLANIDFEVSRNAKMERGELFKEIRMVEGSFGHAGGAAVTSFAAPHTYKIGFPYKLNIKGTSLQTQSTITVLSHSGAPVEGAEIEFTEDNGPQTYVTVTAVNAKVYASADNASAELLTLQQGQQLFATTGSTSGYVNVFLPDGTKNGWIAVADVEQQELKQGFGKSDSKGEIHTFLATLAIGKWFVQAVKDSGISERMTWAIVPQLGTENPEHIQTFVNEDMTTMISASWQTAPRVQQTYIQYVQDSDLPEGTLTPAADKVTEKAAVSELQLISQVENGEKGEILFHKALVTGLKPGTKYHYRVGYEGHWSPWNAYKTADPDVKKPLSFVFVTDSHTKEDNGFDIYQKLMKDAFKNYPATQFVMHGGDVVDTGSSLNEWNQFWKASSIYGASIPSGLTMGNHDVKGEGKEIFAKGMGFPNNGPDGQKQYTYSFDSGETHFIVLNSEASEEDMKKQAEWLRKDIESSKQKWKIAMFHRPAYHTEAGRESLVEYTQTYFAPILEELEVDLVLVGHDHVYAHTYPMKKGKPLKKGERGTVYLDGGAAGWKFYDGIQYDYLDFVFDDDIAVYSAIQVSHDKISIQARTEDGKLVDDYAIVKKDPNSENPGNPGNPPVIDPGTPKPNPDKGPELPANVHLISKAEWETAAKEGKLAIELSKDGGEIRFPMNAAEVLKSGGLTLTVGGSMSLKLSPGQLREAAAGLNADDLLALEVILDDAASSAERVRKAQQKEQVELSASGAAFRLKVSSVKSDGKRQDKSGTTNLTMTLPAGTGNKLTGLYEILQDGSIVYVTGLKVAGKTEVSLATGKVYMLLDYKKTYADLPNSHWAYDYITQLTARHSVQGIDSNHFAPNREVSRSEFAAMLVRELGLKTTATSGFSDVSADAWYAEAVAAAKEAGLVSGTSLNKFNPTAPISRQEMAVMIVRAYELLHPGMNSATGSASASFSDMSNVKGWAKQAVAKAQELGLLSGNGNGQFVPSANGTRAESAKLVLQLSEL